MKIRIYMGSYVCLHEDVCAFGQVVKPDAQSTPNTATICPACAS